MKTMTAFPALLTRLGLTQGALFRGVGLSRSVTSRIVRHDEWPKRGERQAREAIAAWLIEKGATPRDVAFLKKLGPARANDPTPVSPESRAQEESQGPAPAPSEKSGGDSDPESFLHSEAA